MSSKEIKPNKEPFAGAYFVGLAITLAILIGVVAVGAGMPPAVSGFVVAFGLGLTVSPKYARWFLIAGIFSALMGFLGSEEQVAWGGIGLVLSQLIVWRFIKS
ncbi:conserved hypothetical protein [Allomeiothermus silvanus DSM 9946]|uniref:Uncharacterized protein n=1 Tax=Allomeiothermus silvanus (strain ATCC 700542 / DSM 9946 / NBRC 106475 / NCIMB 13440 / VI-R2) TaxID=526227 RepID=D7BEK8_ALLS1|nr:hypothetical protein [Allomeiothermus silvanus]ADH63251.1 conserved hypothetical protein [Allomeiothermus silvanus DSM 9946]